MESDNQLDDEKVVREFNRRALLHKDENAVLDAYDAHEIKRHNVYRNFVHKKTVNSNLRPGKEDVLLDYGCGVGRFAMFLSPLVRQVIGVDTAGDMIDIANDRLNKSKISNICYHHLDSNRIPIEDNAVDKILAWWVLQHISNNKLPEVLSELYRVMKKNGTLVFYEQVRDETKEYGSIHIQRTADEYIQLLQESGFKFVLTKPLLRHPSYGLSIWNKYTNLPKFFLPILALIERLTVNRKPQFADYYTNVFEFIK